MLLGHVTFFCLFLQIKLLKDKLKNAKTHFNTLFEKLINYVALRGVRVGSKLSQRVDRILHYALTT